MNTTAICQGTNLYTVSHVVALALLAYAFGWLMGYAWAGRRK